jgi:hypothetical protein
MKSPTHLFNIILLLALAVGCQTPKEQKDFTTVEFHLETNPAGGWNSITVPIYRENPVPISVEQLPFLDNRDVVRAGVVEEADGFYLQIEFNQHGTLMLEAATRSNPGRRIAIKSMFPETRWLAAPQINRPIDNGILTFTPDASREESERIARGLNNMAAQLEKKGAF